MRLVRTNGDPPWATQLIANERIVVTVICQAPGHHNDWHYHLEDECCVVPQRGPSSTWRGMTAGQGLGGDWMLVPAHAFHLIQVHGSEPAIRIATSIQGEYHRHDRNGSTPRNRLDSWMTGQGMPH